MTTTPPEPEPKPSNTDDVLAKARKLEVRNILSKLTNGKTLTARERDLLAEWAEEQKRGKTLSGGDLGRRWGITRQAVHKYVKAGMPLTSYEEADAWRAENLESTGRGITNKSINSAKLVNLQLEAEKRKIQISRMKAEQISFAQAKQLWSETLIRIADYVRYLDGIDRKQAQSLTRQIRDEAARIVDDLAACVFEEEADGDAITDADQDEEE